MARVIDFPRPRPAPPAERPRTLAEQEAIVDRRRQQLEAEQARLEAMRAGKVAG